MSRNVFEIEKGSLGFALLTADPGSDLATLTIDDFTAYSCQVTSAQITATGNTTDKTTPATWCEPESTETVVGLTSYQIEASFLQDPHIVDGINRFTFEHDAEEVVFYISMGSNDEPPKATGHCTLSAGTIGGAARESLTFDATFPIKTKPIIAFGDAATSEIVGGPSTGATQVSGAEGTWTPSGSQPPGSVADLIAGAAGPHGVAVVASPLTLWAAGSYVTTGDNDHAKWNGSAWVPTTITLMEADAGAEAEPAMAGAGTETTEA